MATAAGYGSCMSFQVCDLGRRDLVCIVWQAVFCVQCSRANLRIAGRVQLLDWVERYALALRGHAKILSTSKQPLSKPFQCVYSDAMVYDGC